MTLTKKEIANSLLNCTNQEIGDHSWVQMIVDIIKTNIPIYNTEEDNQLHKMENLYHTKYITNI